MPTLYRFLHWTDKKHLSRSSHCHCSPHTPTESTHRPVTMLKRRLLNTAISHWALVRLQLVSTGPKVTVSAREKAARATCSALQLMPIHSSLLSLLIYTSMLFQWLERTAAESEPDTALRCWRTPLLVVECACAPLRPLPPPPTISQKRSLTWTIDSIDSVTCLHLYLQALSWYLNAFLYLEHTVDIIFHLCGCLRCRYSPLIFFIASLSVSFDSRVQLRNTIILSPIHHDWLVSSLPSVSLSLSFSSLIGVGDVCLCTPWIAVRQAHQWHMKSSLHW